MPNIEKYSGVDMANIEKISGQDVPSGGITANAVSDNGVQVYGTGGLWTNPDVTAVFNVGAPDTTHTFTKIVGSYAYIQFHALKSDGTLWYWSQSNTYMSSSYFTADGTWRQYGTDTDWEDICGGQFTFGAIKNGNIWFLGSGSYRQRGDGSTGGVSVWTQVNSAGNWSKIYHGFRNAWAINDSGEAYSTGYGYQYMTGQGTTSTIATFTREKNSLTNIVEVKGGYRCTFLRNSSGDVYFTGANNNSKAGPNISTTSDVNGPNLSVDSSVHYVCAALGGHNDHGGCHIDSDGYLRFNGEASSYMRPDNSTTDAKGSSSGLRLTSLGTGWTYYDNMDFAGSSGNLLGIAIKSGTLYMGGQDSQQLKPTFDSTSNQLWIEIRSGVTAAFQRLNVIAAG
jgi:alpha-tubulin suppressor-like RCC1 family protein